MTARWWGLKSRAGDIDLVSAEITELTELISIDFDCSTTLMTATFAGLGVFTSRRASKETEVVIVFTELFGL